ncbi:MAG TPA: flavin reductase family protein [Eoetvoesiella sp.]
MHIDLEKLTERERYKLLMSSVLPRPIALVTTLDAQGRVNAAPFSCFNIMGASPATVVLGIDSHSPGLPKDTDSNIHSTGEFVVNLVAESMVHQTSLCASVLEAGCNELEHAGLTACDSIQVRPPRVLQAPISLECRRTMALDIGNERSIIIGNIVHYHIQDQFYDAERGYVLADKIGLVARMHGRTWYARTTDLFEVDRSDVSRHALKDES